MNESLHANTTLDLPGFFHGISASKSFLLPSRRNRMPAFFRIDKERRLVIGTLAGVATMANALAHQVNLQKHPDFDPSFSQLMDCTQGTKAQLSCEQVQQLARNAIFSPNSRRAILVTGKVAFGLARMFEWLRDSRGEEGIRVFRDLNDAIEWVLAKRAAK
jgi:hypothetical protein